MKLLLLPAVLFLATAPVSARAQRAVIDEGILIVSQGGNRVGRESFRVQAAENGRFVTATGQASDGDTRVAPALSIDSASGTPVLYRVEARGADGSERLQATGRPGRLSVASQRAGGESAKEYVLSGRVLILDDGVYHQHALLPLLGWSGPVTVVIPRLGQQVRGSVTVRGATTVRVDGRAVPARHVVLDLPGGAREIWTDEAGRLLKVAIPSRGIEAVREELPH